MRDTPAATERKFRDMLLRRSSEERLRMGCSMHSTARALVMASVLENNPSASRVAVRKALFLRFYGKDFSPLRRRKILRALTRP